MSAREQGQAGAAADEALLAYLDPGVPETAEPEQEPGWAATAREVAAWLAGLWLAAGLAVALGVALWTRTLYVFAPLAPWAVMALAAKALGWRIARRPR